VRARARKRGYPIHKLRLRSIHEGNLGKYALVNEDSNYVVLGARFDASIEECLLSAAASPATGAFAKKWQA
jgi:hypothetical protein